MDSPARYLFQGVMRKFGQSQQLVMSPFLSKTQFTSYRNTQDGQ